MAYWETGDFVIENYLTGRRVEASAPVVALLAAIDQYTDRTTLTQTLGALAADTLDALISRDLLIVEGSELDELDASVEEWEWGHDARLLHFATRRVTYEPDLGVQKASLAAYAQRVPPPTPFVRRGTGGIKLPDGGVEAATDFWSVLRRRRTRREFTGSSVPLETLSTILRWVWGAWGHEDGGLGPVVLKTSPSGGARHPIEVYTLALRVDGLASGLYHYRPYDHTLGLMRAGKFDDHAVSMLASQQWAGEAAVLFFMTAVLARSMWKYKHSHAYRVLLLDAGHLGQTFQLVCTALGLAAVISSAKDDVSIESFLELDAAQEPCLYVAGAGFMPLGLTTD